MQAFCETERTTFDESTSAYCQARGRMPLTCMQQALSDSAEAADRLSVQGVAGWTRPIKVVDASSVRLPDTAENRAVYPYPSGQRPGCGFPVMQLCGLYSLASGAILNTVQAPWFVHEVRLFRDLEAELQSGDILLGDRSFGAYILLALLPRRGVDVVSRLHQGRRFKPRDGRRIAPGEWLVTWRRPPKRPGYLTAEEWAQVPESITVSIIHVRIHQKGFRSQELWISTTLLDPHAYPAEQIAQLYRRLLEVLASDLVPLRPDRHEPRADKRRPKPYNRPMKPRHLYHEPPHRGKRIQKTPGRKPRLS